MIRRWTPEDDTPKPDSTDYHTVKAWFQECRDLTIQIEAQNQKITRIRDLSEKCTQGLSGMPMGGGNGDKVGFAVEQLDTAERQLQQLKSRLEYMKFEATRRLSYLNGSPRALKQAECIYEYYVKNQKQWAISETTGLKTSGAVSVYINDGLKSLSEIWKDIQVLR